MKTRWPLLIVMMVKCAGIAAQHPDFASTDFSKADSVAALYLNHSLKDMKELAHKLTASLVTEPEKFRAIYVWVCTNIENDYDDYREVKRQREKWRNDPDAFRKWSRAFSKRSFQKLITQHKTICTGYASLVRELAGRAGLSCVVVDGYGRTSQANVGGEGIPNHSWNAVNLNGKWYLCDATWSSGAVNPQQGTFIRSYNNSYFLAEPAVFVRNHYPLDTAWIMLPKKPSHTEFLEGPLVYSAVYRKKISPVFPDSFEVTSSKGKPLPFRFSSNGGQPFTNVAMEINGEKKNVIVRKTDDLYTTDHTFTERGTYLVHLLIDTEYVFSYTVKVK